MSVIVLKDKSEIFCGKLVKGGEGGGIEEIV